MSLSFVKRLCKRRIASPYFHHHSKYGYQMQAENARKMLERKDGSSISSHEIQSLFKNIGDVLDDVSKDPKGYVPSDIDGTEELMSNLRQIRLEYAPDPLKYLCANFLMWFHSFYAKRIYADLDRICVLEQKKKEHEFSKFSTQILGWSDHLSSDMKLVHEILNEIDIEMLSKEGQIDDTDEMSKIVRNMRTNASLHIENYSKYLTNAYNEIMAGGQNINFLDFDEQKLALAASPFLGKLDVCNGLIDKLHATKWNECDGKREVLLEKVLDLPTGLKWNNLYKMYEEGSKYKEIINKWEDDKLRINELNNNKVAINSDLCWFTMDDFKSSIMEIDIFGNNENWEELKQKYQDSGYIAECDAMTMNNSLIKRMGNTAQIICLLGSEQSIFGESILHLTGLWLNEWQTTNGDGDRVLVSGKNTLQMNEEQYLIHEEEWDLFQQYSINENVLFLAGICNTEQRLQSKSGKDLNAPGVPNLVKIKTQIQMRLNRP